MLKKHIKQYLLPAFYHAWRALFNTIYTYYIFKGGRNSGKSTFVSRAIILLMMMFPINTLVVRKVANTLSESVYEQLIDSIESLGVTDYWKRSKSPLGLMYNPRGNRIIFRGADDPVKLKSIKSHKFPIAILWIEEVSEFKNEDEVSTIVNSVIR
ncbi:MAG: phage terminase large subunit, partial [Dysgonamonadaceae bacterium]|nr:phage terminase large subunit [Dysgonamonadaceae bacterium]